MGYIKHHAIVVVSWDSERLAVAHGFAKDLGCQVSEIVPGVVNGYASFLVAPDGSKEGWDHSDEGNARRAKFIAHLNEGAEHYCEWAELTIGPDDKRCAITRHAWRNTEVAE